MKNLSDLMSQMGGLQAKMAELQTQLESMDVDGESGGGLVKATLSGKGTVKAVKIDKSLVDPEEVEVLEDLVAAAINDAKTKVELRAQEEMQKLAGGLPLPPGMKLPF